MLSICSNFQQPCYGSIWLFSGTTYIVFNTQFSVLISFVCLANYHIFSHGEKSITTVCEYIHVHVELVSVLLEQMYIYRRHLLKLCHLENKSCYYHFLLLFRLLAEMSSGVVLTGTGMWEKGQCNFSVKSIEEDHVKNELYSDGKFKCVVCDNVRNVS